MKKLRIYLALTLVVALIASIAAISSAEVQVEEDWQADIQTLMDESLLPKATTVQYDHALPEGTEQTPHAYAIEKIGSDGTTLRIDFDLIATSDFTDADWEAVDEWLSSTASAAIQGIAADTESLANVVAEAIADARRDAQRAQSAEPWASEALLVSEITVTLPYYPELTSGVNGAATQRLQEALIRLGYLNDDADGYFGPNTQAAVEALEEHIRALEQDVIDALPTVEPTQTPEPTPTPNPDASAEPTEQPEPTPTPEPQPTPATPVDGVADAPLQAYLYSDAFKPARTALEQGDSGDAVLRMQRRLIQLGCMVGQADGIYGKRHGAVRAHLPILQQPGADRRRRPRDAEPPLL